MAMLENITIRDESKYVLFLVESKRYAISVQHVLEVLRLPELEFPEKLPKFICGLLNYNNMVINIVDIYAILGNENKTYTLNNQLLMVKTDESILGIIIDEVIDLISISPTNIQSRPYNAATNFVTSITYIDSEMVFILDLRAIEKFIKDNSEFNNENNTGSQFQKDADSKGILAERKKYLTQKSDYINQQTFFDEKQYMWFTIGNYNYCLDIEYVRELVKKEAVDVTEIPCTPDFLYGVMPFKGDFISVIDLSNFLGISETKKNEVEYSKIIVLNVADFKMSFWVEEVKDILKFSSDDIKQSYNEVNKSKYISGEFLKNNKLFQILNIRAILQNKQLYIDESL